jgi:hypothetical protein
MKQANGLEFGKQKIDNEDMKHVLNKESHPSPSGEGPGLQAEAPAEDWVRS